MLLLGALRVETVTSVQGYRLLPSSLLRVATLTSDQLLRVTDG